MAADDPVVAEDPANKARQACIAGEYASCCQIIKGEEPGFYEMDAEFAEYYLRSPCRARGQSAQACTYLGIAMHLADDERAAQGRDLLRVGCFSGDRDACQWLEHLGVEVRGIPVTTSDDALGHEAFERGCLFRSDD